MSLDKRSNLVHYLITGLRHPFINGVTKPVSFVHNFFTFYKITKTYFRADSWFAPSQWETSLQSNAVSHWLGANLESALYVDWWISYSYLSTQFSCWVTVSMACEQYRVMSQERHGVSDHRPFNCPFNILFGLTSKKHQKSNHWSFVKGIHRWPVISPHEGPVMRKAFPYHDVIMLLQNQALLNSRFLTRSPWPFPSR